MKVKIEFTVDIDPQAWDLNYGTGTSAAAVREDVRDYARHIVYAQFRESGAIQ